MVTEKTIAFTSIFMAKIATQIFDRSAKKLLICCNIDNTISLLHTNRDAVNQFIEQTYANKYHPTIKFMAEISVSEATF